MKRHPALETLIGTWHTKGHTVSGPSLSVEGTDRYAWYEGADFVLHHVAVKMGDENMVALEIISNGETDDYFPMHFFGAGGATQASEGSFSNGTWTFTSATERGMFTFSNDGKILSGTWEKLSENKKWQPWLQVVLTKQ